MPMKSLECEQHQRSTAWNVNFSICIRQQLLLPGRSKQQRNHNHSRCTGIIHRLFYRSSFISGIECNFGGLSRIEGGKCTFTIGTGSGQEVGTIGTIATEEDSFFQTSGFHLVGNDCTFSGITTKENGIGGLEAITERTGVKSVSLGVMASSTTTSPPVR